MFCGDNGLYLGPLANIGALAPSPIASGLRIDITVGDLNVDFRTGFRQAITLTKPAGSPNIAMIKSTNCVMFTSASDNVC